LSEDDTVVFGGWSGNNKEAPGVLFSLKDKVKAPEGEQLKEEPEETVDYCMTLRTADMTWSQNKFVGVPASKRYGHTTTAIGPHLIIIGGWDGGKPLSDVIVLRDRSIGDNATGEDEAIGAEVGVQGMFDRDEGEEDMFDKADAFGEEDDFELETGDN
jgi:hypothetical protein